MKTDEKEFVDMFLRLCDTYNVRFCVKGNRNRCSNADELDIEFWRHDARDAPAFMTATDNDDARDKMREAEEEEANKLDAMLSV